MRPISMDATGAASPPKVGLWRPICLGLIATAWAFAFSWCTLALALLVLLSIFSLSGEWLVAVLCAAAAIPAIGLGALTGFGAYMDDLHRQRRFRGWCTRCGYDLRASCGRCPECGTPYVQRLWKRRTQ